MASLVRGAAGAGYPQRADQFDDEYFEAEPRPLRVAKTRRGNSRPDTGAGQRGSRADGRSSPELGGDYLVVAKRRGKRGDVGTYNTSAPLEDRLTPGPLETSTQPDVQRAQSPLLLNRLAGFGRRLSRRISSSSRDPSDYTPRTASGRIMSWVTRRSSSMSSGTAMRRFSGGTLLPGPNHGQLSPLLYPYVTVAPECASVEIRQREVWVAVEVTGRVFNGHGGASDFRRGVASNGKAVRFGSRRPCTDC